MKIFINMTAMIPIAILTALVCAVGTLVLKFIYVCENIFEHHDDKWFWEVLE